METVEIISATINQGAEEYGFDAIQRAGSSMVEMWCHDIDDLEPVGILSWMPIDTQDLKAYAQTWLTGYLRGVKHGIAAGKGQVQAEMVKALGLTDVLRQGGAS